MNVGAAVGNAKEQKHASEDIRQYRLKSSRLKPQTRGQTQEDGFTRLIIGMINDNQELFDVNGSKRQNLEGEVRSKDCGGAELRQRTVCGLRLRDAFLCGLKLWVEHRCWYRST